LLSLKDLQQNLKEYELSIFKVPLIMQFNKRDLGSENIAIMDLKRMEHDLNRQLKVPFFSGSALKGDGVGKTLHACLKLVMQSVQNELS
jgi:GTPase involved in cell partitioning and DNA repair